MSLKLRKCSRSSFSFFFSFSLFLFLCLAGKERGKEKKERSRTSQGYQMHASDLLKWLSRICVYLFRVDISCVTQRPRTLAVLACVAVVCVSRFVFCLCCWLYIYILANFISFDSSVGRASDWRSEGPVFDSQSKHSFCRPMKTNAGHDTTRHCDNFCPPLTDILFSITRIKRLDNT